MAGEIKTYPTTKSGPGDATQVTSTAVEGDKSSLDVFVRGSSQSENTVIIDPDTTANTVYYGWAPIGSATSGAVWRIMRETLVGCTATFDWADSDNSYDNVWDNRAGLTYG